MLPEKVETCLSDEIFIEYAEVMNREKFSKFIGFNTKADRKVEVLTDTSDNKFLELAAVSSADYLITGNTLHFQITEFEYTRILTPRKYWDYFQP